MLIVDGLEKHYPGAGRRAADVPAVRDVSLEVSSGDLFTVVGPSGCGKTTTLRCIAGLERPDGGRIELDGRTLFEAGRVDIPTNDRGLGMVFQSYAVWPHLDVFSNVAFPLEVLPRRRRAPRHEVERRVERILAAVKLSDLAGRPATDLSSGQQQRVALARALITEPPLLLLDEPLSNIDAKLREEMRAELLRLQRELGVTTVFVTHDQAEALALSDQMAVMNDGRVEQVGPPRVVYDRPASSFVADFIGSANLLHGTVSHPGSTSLQVKTVAGPLHVPGGPATEGQAVTVAVRPERISVVTDGGEGSSGLDGASWAGTVVGTSFLGDATEHTVDVGFMLRVRTDASRTFAPGTRVVVRLPPEHCVAYLDEGGDDQR